MTLIVLCFLWAFIVVEAGVTLTGVNLSGAEFGSSDIPGKEFSNYVWNTPSDAKYFVDKGMNVYRIPFLWERMQPVPGGPLASEYLGGLQTLVSYLTNNSRYSVIDPHNYGRGFGGIIGQSATSISLYADFWYKLAMEFKGNPWVIFGLMNEPNNQDVHIWEKAAQTAIEAIRFTGATNQITVPGIDWTGAWSWGDENAPVMISITDPINNFVFEVHQYLDIDGSGTHPTCVNSTIGVDRIDNFTQWARANKRRGYLGEFGVGPNTICEEALAGMTTYMDTNDDVWFAWTYWAGGPWWGNGYFTNLSPNSSGIDRPQMAYLQPHFPKTTPNPPTFPTPTGSYTPPSSFAKYMPVYLNGKLQSPFEDYSWAPHSLNYTGTTYNSTFAINADFSHYNALWFKCEACVNNSLYFAFQFWVNVGTNGSISQIDFYLMNGTSKEKSEVGLLLGNYLSAPAAPNTWVQASIPLGWFEHAMHDGIQISGNVNGPVGEMYFDQLQFVAYEDPYSWQKLQKGSSAMKIQIK
eukprot:Phypoly_transcript_07062.p1 GENE.Phypoly_transcript_07062~~Phypoly_transcript_07062.p1  ORF type:complete len:522 (+),score=69.42 Phypoly_transcript_07062:45-1610(+)